jgi:hypothetical protein
MAMADGIDIAVGQCAFSPRPVDMRLDSFGNARGSRCAVRLSSGLRNP